ncbi:MAG: hypothetical protein B6241_15425 [Spirochaetaceae bacterium 4572_59]|nr:MAG: hypothetical protein B6241_15425 [Spirochaetaceae bacterium 4572_59]
MLSRIKHHLTGDCFSPIDRVLTAIHERIFLRNKLMSMLFSLIIYVNILLFLGNVLKISSNYFVILPIITATLCFGFIGGVISGILGLPANLFLFSLIGHLEYAPASWLVAECFGIIIGISMGYLSDYINKMNREIQKRRITEEQLRRTLSEKELLLQEINHRVRNNLNIIKSIIQLHMNRVDDPIFKKECQKLKQRIFSIALVHEQLYLEGHSVYLDLKNYLSSLLDNLISRSADLGVQLKTYWPEGVLPFVSDRGIYLGLLVHEVITNSIKYASTETDFPSIVFELVAIEDKYQITIRDNGTGFDPDNSESGLGLKLIQTLSMQVNGHHSFTIDDGMVFRLEFPSK